MSFDGAECRVEIRFPHGPISLRRHPISFWRKLAEMAGAKIISSLASNSCQAHILSESSLFVFDQRLIMITCGASGAARAAAHLVSLLKSTPSLIIYSRTHGLCPETSQARMETDRQILLQAVPEGRWATFHPPGGRPAFLFAGGRMANGAGAPGFELTMLDIRQEAGRAFGREGRMKVTNALERSGIIRFLRGYRIESHSFRPEGFSLNAVSGNDYLSLHVSPEDGGSYVGIKSSAIGGFERLLASLTGFFSPRRALLLMTDGSITQAPMGYRSTPASLPSWAEEMGFDFTAYEPISVESARATTPLVDSMAIAKPA